MASCFGLIISGRLVQTDFQQIDENKFLINIPDADNINYLVKYFSCKKHLENSLKLLKILGDFSDWIDAAAFGHCCRGVLELARPK